MALPTVGEPIAAKVLNAHMTDMSSATVPTSSAYIPIPFRCRVLLFGMMQFGAITSANAVITIAQNGTTINGADSNGTTANVLTILTSGAAGTRVTYAPSTIVHCVEGDNLSFVSAHGSSTACPANCYVVVVPE